MKDERVLFDKVSVPDVIQLPNGRIIIYAVDGAMRSKSGLLLGVSDDNGKTWQWGSLQVVTPRGFVGADPDAVLLNDGRVRLYYVVPPFPGAQRDPKTKIQIKSAISQDGINFVEEEGVCFAYPMITDPDVLRIADRWMMYLSIQQQLIAASSEDGLNFKFEKMIRKRGSVSNTVSIDTVGVRQFFCIDGNIKSAVSSDGLNWQNEPGFRIEPSAGRFIGDPAPVRTQPGWLLFYKFYRIQ